MASTMRSMSRILTRASRSAVSPIEHTAALRTPAGLFSANLRAANNSSTSNVGVRRSFSTSPLCLRARTMGQLKARHSTGPFSWKAALLFVLTGGGMIIYFRVEKERLERKRIAEMSKGVGKPKVGGPFTLKDLDGKEFTAEDLKGKYSFVSISFL